MRELTPLDERPEEVALRRLRKHRAFVSYRVIIGDRHEIVLTMPTEGQVALYGSTLAEAIESARREVDSWKR